MAGKNNATPLSDESAGLLNRFIEAITQTLSAKLSRSGEMLSVPQRQLLLLSDLLYTIAMDLKDRGSKESPTTADATAALLKQMPADEVIHSLELSHFPPRNLYLIKQWAAGELARLWSVKEFAELVGLTPRRISQYAETNVIGTRIDEHWRFGPEDIQKLATVRKAPRHRSSTSN